MLAISPRSFSEKNIPLGRLKQKILSYFKSVQLTILRADYVNYKVALRQKIIDDNILNNCGH